MIRSPDLLTEMLHDPELLMRVAQSAFNEAVGSAQQDQRSLETRGAGLLIIILAGLGVLFWVYQTWAGGRGRPPT